MKSMLSLAEMLQTKVKGLNEWRPACETRQQVMQNKPNSLTEQNLAVILKAMGTKRWTAYDLSEALNEKRETVRKRLERLITQGKVKKSTQKQPYVYFRIND